MMRSVFPLARVGFRPHRSARRKRPARAFASVPLLALAGALHAAVPGELDHVIVDDLYRQAELASANDQRSQAVALLDTLVGMGPVQAGTWLDAAILYCQLGQGDKSRALLDRIRRELDPPDAIRRLIELRMNEPCSATIGRPSFYAAASGGWTSNANYAPSVRRVELAAGAPFQQLELAPGSQARGDAFMHLDVNGEVPIPVMEGWSVTGTFSDRQYRSMREFDSALAGVGVAHRMPIADGLLESQLNIGQYWLGNRPYERFAGLQSGYWFGQTRVIGAPARFGVDVALTEQRYEGNTLYDARRAEVRAKAEFQPTDYVNVLISAGPAWDRPTHDRPGGPRLGYNALFGVNLQVWRNNTLSLLFQQQSLKDRDPYSPVFFGNIVRRQTIRQLSVRYAIPLQARTYAYAQFTWQDVNDSIPLFSYKVSTGSMGLAYTY
jgi:hypothetical protein